LETGLFIKDFEGIFSLTFPEIVLSSGNNPSAASMNEAEQRGVESSVQNPAWGSLLSVRTGRIYIPVDEGVLIDPFLSGN
jgi:hypothetical protein